MCPWGSVLRTTFQILDGGIRFLHLEMGRRRGPFEPRGHREAVRLTPLVRGVIGGVRHERFRHEGAFCIINTEN